MWDFFKAKTSCIVYALTAKLYKVQKQRSLWHTRLSLQTIHGNS